MANDRTRPRKRRKVCNFCVDKVTSIEEWGKRRLAYPISDLPEGYYVLMNCECKPELPAELDRVFKITDGILRSIIVAVEA